MADKSGARATTLAGEKWLYFVHNSKPAPRRCCFKENTRSPTRINMQQTVKEEEETKLSINMTVSGFEWVYNAGSSWAPLDQYTQHTIERLWSCNGASWVSSPSFGGQQIYIDTSEMSLVISGYSYTIARRQPRRQQQTRKRRM